MGENDHAGGDHGSAGPRTAQVGDTAEKQPVADTGRGGDTAYDVAGRRLSRRTLVAASAATFLAVCAVLIGAIAPHLDRHDPIPTGDLAADMLWGHAALPPGGFVIHGHHSLVVLPHPGPAYLWTIAAGQRAAAALEYSPSLGASIAFYVLVALVVAAGAGSFMYASGSMWPGVAYTVAVLAWGERVAEVTVPVLVAYTLAWVFAAAYAASMRRRWAAVLLAASGSLLGQLYLETLPVALVATVAAVAVAWRSRDRAVRAWSAAVLAPTVLIAAGRLTTEGVGVFGEYLRQAEKTKAWFTDRPPVSLYDAMANSTPLDSAGSVRAVAVIALIAAGACLIARRPGMAATLAGSVAFIWWYGTAMLVPGNGTQESVLMAVPAVTAALVCAGVVLAGRRALSRQPRRVARLCATLAVSVVAFDCVAAWPAHDTADVLRHQIWFRTGTPLARFDEAAMPAEARTRPLAVAYVRAAYGPSPDIAAALPALVWFSEHGYDICEVQDRYRQDNPFVPESQQCPDDLGGRTVVGVVIDGDIRHDTQGGTAGGTHSSARHTTSLGEGFDGRQYRLVWHLDEDPNTAAATYQPAP